MAYEQWILGNEYINFQKNTPKKIPTINLNDVGILKISTNKSGFKIESTSTRSQKNTSK